MIIRDGIARCPRFELVGELFADPGENHNAHRRLMGGGDVVVMVSPSIVDELVEVVQRPRLQRHMTADPQVLIDLIVSDAVYTRGDLSLPGASRDPKDDKFLACAVEGKADYIVTGDEDLLTLTQFQDFPIVRPFDFVRILDAMQTDNINDSIR